MPAEPVDALGKIVVFAVKFNEYSLSQLKRATWSASVNVCGFVADKQEPQRVMKPFTIFSDEPSSETAWFVLCMSSLTRTNVLTDQDVNINCELRALGCQ